MFAPKPSVVSFRMTRGARVGSPPGLATSTSSSTCGASDSRQRPGRGRRASRSRPRRRRSYKPRKQGAGPPAGRLGPGELAPRGRGRLPSSLSRSASASLDPAGELDRARPADENRRVSPGLRQCPGGGRDDWCPEGHRLEHREPEPLVARREDQTCGSAVEARDSPGETCPRNWTRSRRPARSTARSASAAASLVRPHEDETRPPVAENAPPRSRRRGSWRGWRAPTKSAYGSSVGARARPAERPGSTPGGVTTIFSSGTP